MQIKVLNFVVHYGKPKYNFSGVLPHAHPAMETFDPRFRSSRDLVRDLMVPSFLNNVSE